MEPSGKLIWPVKPPLPAMAAAANSREIPLYTRVILAGMRGLGGIPDPPDAGVNSTRTCEAVAPGVAKVRVSPAVKAAAWASVMVSKV